MSLQIYSELAGHDISDCAVSQVSCCLATTVVTPTVVQPDRFKTNLVFNIRNLCLVLWSNLSSSTVKTVNLCDKATVITGLACLFSFPTYVHRSEGFVPNCHIQRMYSDSLNSLCFTVIVALTDENLPILFNIYEEIRPVKMIPEFQIKT